LKTLAILLMLLVIIAQPGKARLPRVIRHSKKEALRNLLDAEGLNLLRESTKYLNQLFDSGGTGFCFRSA
jgi:hypothetical protein